MSMRKVWALFLAALVAAGPLAAERVALVIGNGAYRGGEITSAGKFSRPASGYALRVPPRRAASSTMPEDGRVRARRR